MWSFITEVYRIIRSETTKYTYINFVIFVVKHFTFVNIYECKKVLKKTLKEKNLPPLTPTFGFGIGSNPFGSLLLFLLLFLLVITLSLCRGESSWLWSLSPFDEVSVFCSAIITYCLTSNLKRWSLFKFEMVTLWYVCTPKDYEDDAPSLLKATHHRFFVDDCKIIKWWCDLSTLVSLQWLEVIQSHIPYVLFSNLFSDFSVCSSPSKGLWGILLDVS